MINYMRESKPFAIIHTKKIKGGKELLSIECDSKGMKILMSLGII